MRRLWETFIKVIIAGLLFFVFSVVARVSAQDCTGGGAAYCNCPCNVLCDSVNNCAHCAQICLTTTTYCGANIPEGSCGIPIFDEYGNFVSCGDSGCVTQSTNCSQQIETYTCPYYVNPCINICGATPTASPTPAPTPPTCPNGTCTAGESCANCYQDCGACPVVGAIPTSAPAGTCPNGSCGAGESCDNCSADCGTCPGEPACNPDLWGNWNGTCLSCDGPTSITRYNQCVTPQTQQCLPYNSSTVYGSFGSCSGSPATKTHTNQCGTSETVPCTGTIQARAVEIFSPTDSCATVRASTYGINGASHRFTAGSASQPAAQTQSGASYVTFSGVVGGSYTISPTVPAYYILTRACWSRTLNAPTSGEGLSAYLSVPTDGETLTWDIGYLAGTPWVQTQGGDVNAAGTLKSSIPWGTSPRVFVTNGTGGSPGVAIYGTSYDFDSDPTLTGGTFVSSKNWLVNQTQASINYYEYFWRKLGGGTAVDSFADLGAVSKPASRATPYYVVGNMTTTGDWTIPNGETVIFIVNGNLTLGGKVNLTGSGFAAFIVNGNITVSSSVGGLYTSSTPVVEGIYVTSPTGTFKTGTSTVVGKERLVGQGIFMAGGFLLQRDLDSINQNTTTSSELFLYNPRLLFSMPDSLRDVPITWEEVAP